MKRPQPRDMRRGDDPMLTVEEAAARMRVGRTRLFKALRDGELKSVKWGGRRLVARADVDALVEKLREA